MQQTGSARNPPRGVPMVADTQNGINQTLNSRYHSVLQVHWSFIHTRRQLRPNPILVICGRCAVVLVFSACDVHSCTSLHLRSMIDIYNYEYVAAQLKRSSTSHRSLWRRVPKKKLNQPQSFHLCLTNKHVIICIIITIILCRSLNQKI